MKSNFDDPSGMAQGLYDQLLDKLMEFEGAMLSSTVIGVLEMLKTQIVMMSFDSEDDDEDN